MIDPWNEETSWLIAVDAWHRVSILEFPDMASEILAPQNAEEIGFPAELPTYEPGVYHVICQGTSDPYYELGDPYELSFEILRARRASMALPRDLYQPLEPPHEKN